MNDLTVSILSTICAQKTVTLNRNELNLLAKETGMVHLSAWGGWKIIYEKIAPNVYSVKLGGSFRT